MPKRRQSHHDRTDALAERIIRLADLLFHGNQSEMGRVLEVDQSAISRMLARRQSPNLKVVEGLASQPGVNLFWLFTGMGEPLVDAGVEPKGRHFRPVSTHLLPGQPADHPGLLSVVSYPVAEPFYSSMCYWHRLTADSPITRKRRDIVVNDMLLIEAGEAWTRRRDAVVGRLIVAPIRIRNRLEFVLAEVNAWSKTTLMEYAFQQFPVEIYYDEDDRKSKEKKAKAKLELPEVWLIVPEFGMSGELAGDPNTASGLQTTPDVAPGAVLLRLEDIAGVCVKLERYWAS